MQLAADIGGTCGVHAPRKYRAVEGTWLLLAVATFFQRLSSIINHLVAAMEPAKFHSYEHAFYSKLGKGGGKGVRDGRPDGIDMNEGRNQY